MITVTPQMTRLNDCSNVAGWTVVGGGQRLSEDYGPQGGVALARTINHLDSGFAFKLESLINFAPGGNSFGQRIYFWFKVTTPNELLSVRLRLGSNVNNPDENWKEWLVDTAEYDGEWLRVAVDPSSQHWDAHKSGTSGLYRWVGVMFCVGNISGQIKRNCLTDAIDLGTGITVSGGTEETPLTFEDIANADDYGVVQTDADNVKILGNLTLDSCYLSALGKGITFTGVGDDTNYFKATESTISFERCEFQTDNSATIDFDSPNDVTISQCDFHDIVGDPFKKASIAFNPVASMVDTSFTACGLITGGIHTNSIVVDSVPQPKELQSVQAFSSIKGTYRDGTLVMNDRELKFTPFDTGLDNRGDIYYFGSDVEFDSLTIQGEHILTRGVIWLYYDGDGWRPLNPLISLSSFVGELMWVQPPGWVRTSIHGSGELYFISARVIDLGYSKSDPTSRFAHQIPIG